MSRSRFSVESFDEMAKSVFAQAFERASTQDHIDPLPPGHISLEDRERGGPYAKWRRYGLNGKPLPPEYLGVAGGAPHQAAASRLAELEALPGSAQTLRKSSVKVPELGAYATALSHLDYLLANRHRGTAVDLRRGTD